jgi:hypothetical protein
MGRKAASLVFETETLYAAPHETAKTIRSSLCRGSKEQLRIRGIRLHRTGVPPYRKRVYGGSHCSGDVLINRTARRLLSELLFQEGGSFRGRGVDQ